MSLTASDFDAYFEAIHGKPPFPWQSRLLACVATEGRWPDLLDLPTGTGKTAALDVAVFAQALEADKPPAQRQCPRRTIMVVDRRTVVDQGYLRGLQIAKQLKHSQAPILHEVRQRLLRLSPNCSADSPLGVHVLRGGIPRDDTWTRDPTQPLIAVSTVDQVGSRLLFRGYGVSSSMQPLHAGLLGNDVLFLLDEVHLATAFRDTLTALGERYRGFGERGLPDRWQVVQMSATPGAHNIQSFGLEQADREHSLLQKRLRAKKPTRLVSVPGTARDALPKAMAAAVKEHGPRAHAIGIVVNRVETARLVHELLEKHFSKQEVQVTLVTGRMRPLDRETVGNELVAALAPDRERAKDRFRVVVATQCIEAGADFDFDVLLTECASLDALRQRFGRLNRIGESTAEIEYPGMVFIREADVEGKDAGKDPIYGAALRETWLHLRSLLAVDFGLSAFVAPPDDVMERLITPPTQAPLLLPAHLDAWVQTAPTPHADPDPALFLRGPAQRDRDVSLIWRADIDEESIRAAQHDSTVLDLIQQRLEACPPRTMEALQVPVAAAIRWLRGEKPPSISDVANLEPEEPEDSLERSRPALVWNEHALEYVDVAQRRSQLRPNSTLIVPSEYGGLHALNWDPSSTEPVSDLGDRAQREQRHDVVLRLHAAVMASALPSETLSRPPRQPHADDTESDEHELVAAYLEQLPNPKEEWLAKNIEALLGEYRGAGRLSEGDRVQNRKAPRLIAVSPLPSEAAQGELAPMLIVRARRPSFDMGAEADQSSLTGVEVPLASHVNGVASHAREFALAVGLPAELVEVLERAGLWHDAGKADPRFQQWLHGGSAFRALKAEQLLAKSAMPHQDRARRELARQRAGYPKGARHELLSLALLNSLQQPLGPVHHWDLVKHLIASHHGHCRPFAPFVADSEPVDVGYEVETQRVRASSATGVEQLDSGVSDRFWGLVERYGWYGLSWLEAILRLADHRQSEAEQKTGHDSEEQSHAA